MGRHNFLFWNMDGLPRSEALCRMVKRHDVQSVVLAEPGLPVKELVASTSEAADAEFHAVRSNTEKVIFLTTVSRKNVEWSGFDNSSRFAIFRMHFGRMDVLIACAHLISRLHAKDGDQTLEATRFVDSIVRVENQWDHRRTIVVGDLNMNPFDDGLIAARCLHAVPTKALAELGSRTIDGAEYPFFYNPMWNFFGDQTPGPPGTYFYSQAVQTVHFWNIFDQVLVRPALLDFFQGPTILESDGENSLLKNTGRPSRRTGSDHLPLLFSLNVPQPIAKRGSE
jgi:hypothetical protein